MKTNNPTPQSFAGKYGTKMLLIGIISLVLIIASSTIWLLAYDREQTSEDVNREVTSLWGGPVRIDAPRISFGNDINDQSPSAVDFTATLENEQLNRNIYTTNVYNATVSVSGTFAAAEAADSLNATFVMPIMADKIMESGELTLGSKKYPLDFKYGELRATIDRSSLTGAETKFALTFKVRGSKSIDFTPVVAKNCVTISGNCPMPSFKGVELPVERTVSSDGFTAKWVNINTALCRDYYEDDFEADVYPGGPYPTDEVYGDYPQEIAVETITDTTQYTLADSLGLNLPDTRIMGLVQWRENQGNCEVEFVTGVDSYRKVVRAIKFAYLIILLTFIAVFATEVLSRRNIPLLNYFLIGAALVVFYTLLLSMSELIGFDLGYLIAAIMTVGLITLYLRTSVGSSRLAAFNGLFVSIVYICCYIMICMGNLALLIGSLMIFLAIAASMYVSVKFSENQS